MHRSPHVGARAATCAALLLLALGGAACSDDAQITGPDDAPAAGLTVNPTVTHPPMGPGTTAPPARASAVPPPPVTSALSGLTATTLADGLREPVGVIASPDGAALWVLERTGRILAVTPSSEPEGRADISVVLDLTGEVLVAGAEQGLLSVALHPGYPDGGGAFVYLVTADDDHTELRHYESFEGEPNRLDPASARLVLAVEQPHEWHNGGTVLFGPDGYLYLSLGDGGRIGDPYGHAQDPGTLLGTVVRLDVDANRPYAIPPDNPFARRPPSDGGAAPEVWLYGLRNPWRISIDVATSRMVIADVGHDQGEEINVAHLHRGGGLNFGWPVLNGNDCFQTRADREAELPAPECDADGFEPPVLTIDRSQGCAVIGGPVYRGTAIPELWGHYVYSDYCRGAVRSFPLDDAIAGREPEPVQHLDLLGRITSVGTDASGELVLTDQNGALYRIDPIREG